MKDRVYFLKGGNSPLTLTIPGKAYKKTFFIYFDEKSGNKEK